MPGTQIHSENITGLPDNEIPRLQQQFGKNIFSLEKPRRFYRLLVGIVREPMFLLLIVACTLYFILDEPREGWMMLAAMLFVSAISFYQDIKNTRAMDALKELTEPKIIVIRNGAEKMIACT